MAAALRRLRSCPNVGLNFIGNSITCGYGVESENPKDPFTYDTENHFYTYAARTARALKAQHLVVARSGIGIYRNYAGPRSGSKDCMPAMYEQVLLQILPNCGTMLCILLM